MKNNLTKKISELLIYGYFLAFLLYSIAPFFASFYADISLPIEFVVMTLIFALNFRRFSKDLTMKVMLFVALAFGALSIVLTHGGSGSFLNLSRFLMGVIIFSTIELQPNGRKRLYVLCGIIWLCYLVLSPFIWNLYKNSENFYNPNTIGDGLFFTSTILVHFAGEKKNKNALVIIVLTLIGILLSQCRSALVAEIVYLMALYVPFLRNLIEKNKERSIVFYNNQWYNFSNFLCESIICHACYSDFGL